MTAQSANALAGFSAILVVVGLFVLSHSAGFLLMVLAAVSALLPLAFGPKPTRIAAVLLLIASTVTAVTFYPDFKEEQNRIAGRAKKNSTPKPASGY
jgi:hypothetical protein